jgi:cell division protein FtsX
MATGCGASVRTATVTVSTTVQSEASVDIYFCTADTCPQEATEAQMSAVSRRASASPLVAKVIFQSKEEALALLAQKHPEETKALPTNPFPNRLTVIPKRSDDVEKVAAQFTADPKAGIFTVQSGR